MKKENFIEEYCRIYDLHQKYENEIKDKLQNLLLSAQSELGNFFISKGFIHHKYTDKWHYIYNYYYDPEIKVGILLKPYTFIHIDNDYNSIQALIVYKCKNKFLQGEKSILFFFKKEGPENAYKRFKKYIGKTEIRRMKNILRRKFPKEMLIDDRTEKIKTINEKKPSI